MQNVAKQYHRKSKFKIIRQILEGYSSICFRLFLTYVIIFIAITIVESIRNIMSGFSLYAYLPGWIRFVIMDLIASALLAFPSGIVAGFFISISIEDFHDRYIEKLRNILEIRCIECYNTIRPQGTWSSGDVDIRCGECEALMTLTIEESKFKKLVLKQGSPFSQDEIKTRKKRRS